VCSRSARVLRPPTRSLYDHLRLRQPLQRVHRATSHTVLRAQATRAVREGRLLLLRWQGRTTASGTRTWRGLVTRTTQHPPRPHHRSVPSVLSRRCLVKSIKDVLSRGGWMQAPIVPLAAPEPNIGAGHGNAPRPDGTIQHLGGFIDPALGASLAVSLSPVSLSVSTATLTPLCLLPRGLSLSLSVSLAVSLCRLRRWGLTG
jgi:hypothetical protein